MLPCSDTTGNSWKNPYPKAKWGRGPTSSQSMPLLVTLSNVCLNRVDSRRPETEARGATPRAGAAQVAGAC